MMDHSNNLFKNAAIPANFINNPVLKSTQENLTKLMQSSVIGNFKDGTVPFVDQAQIEKRLKLTSTALTANTYVMSDTLSLMTSLAHEGFESVIKQLQVLSKCGDIDEVVQAQHAYAQSIHDTVIERTTMNAKLMAGVLETNASIAKEALIQK